MIVASTLMQLQAGSSPLFPPLIPSGTVVVVQPDRATAWSDPAIVLQAIGTVVALVGVGAAIVAGVFARRAWLAAQDQAKAAQVAAESAQSQLAIAYRAEVAEKDRTISALLLAVRDVVGPHVFHASWRSDLLAKGSFALIDECQRLWHRTGEPNLTRVEELCGHVPDDISRKCIQALREFTYMRESLAVVVPRLQNNSGVSISDYRTSVDNSVDSSDLRAGLAALFDSVDELMKLCGRKPDILDVRKTR